MPTPPAPSHLAALAAAERYRQALVHGGAEAAAAATAALRDQPDALKLPPDGAPDEAAITRAGDGVVHRSGISLPFGVQLRMTHVPLGMVDLFEEGERPLITVTAPAGQHVRAHVTAVVEGFSTSAIGTLTTDGKQPATLDLLPTFAPAHAARLTRPVRAAVRVTIRELDGGRVPLERTYRLWLLPPTTAVTFEQDPSTGRWSSLAEYLAGWVTPDDPAIMGVLRKAAELTRERGLVGYQTGEDGVREGVRAIYGALQQHGLVYLNSVAAHGAANAFVQRVRLPAESLRDRGANCLDGAVLYASLFEAASLEAGVVLMPSHAYVAWRARSGGPWEFLETIMTGTHDFAAAHAQATRLHAAIAGQADVRVLDIAALRKQGYLAMA
jgi:hypothetical protein